MPINIKIKGSNLSGTGKEKHGQNVNFASEILQFLIMRADPSLAANVWQPPIKSWDKHSSLFFSSINEEKSL
jgi:hypothetical protein